MGIVGEILPVGGSSAVATSTHDQSGRAGKTFMSALIDLGIGPLGSAGDSVKWGMTEDFPGDSSCHPAMGLCQCGRCRFRRLSSAGQGIFQGIFYGVTDIQTEANHVVGLGNRGLSLGIIIEVYLKYT